MNLSPGLIAHYGNLWRTMKYADGTEPARRIVDAHHDYVRVMQATGVPWFVIGISHWMENSGDVGAFRCHLHNGDPLWNRGGEAIKTINDPSGRGPFDSWIESAIDAVRLKLVPFAKLDWHSVQTVLWWLERYNGWGYMLYHPEVNSPYLWGRTSHHVFGKYVSDGTYDPHAMTRQTGAAAILHALIRAGDVQELAVLESEPVSPFDERAGMFEASRLQHYLNTFPGLRLKTDGVLGPKTKARYQEVFG